jgi:hypothetical protein
MAGLLPVLDWSASDGRPYAQRIEPELLLHADQELGHAVLVTNRIIQLGGTPVINPKDWAKYARCPYDEPSDPYIEVILDKTSMVNVAPFNAIRKLPILLRAKTIPPTRCRSNHE